MNSIHDPSAEALNTEGCALCEQAQFYHALEVFDQAIALDHTYCTAWNNRANALCGLNRQAEALAAYDQAVALNPQYRPGLTEASCWLTSVPTATQWSPTIGRSP